MCDIARMPLVSDIGTSACGVVWQCTTLGGYRGTNRRANLVWQLGHSLSCEEEVLAHLRISLDAHA